jgi:hypothetical protein
VLSERKKEALSCRQLIVQVIQEPPSLFHHPAMNGIKKRSEHRPSQPSAPTDASQIVYSLVLALPLAHSRLRFRLLDNVCTVQYCKDRLAYRRSRITLRELLRASAVKGKRTGILPSRLCMARRLGMEESACRRCTLQCQIDTDTETYVGGRRLCCRAVLCLICRSVQGRCGYGWRRVIGEGHTVVCLVLWD